MEPIDSIVNELFVEEHCRTGKPAKPGFERGVEPCWLPSLPGWSRISLHCGGFHFQVHEPGDFLGSRLCCSKSSKRKTPSSFNTLGTLPPMGSAFPSWSFGLGGLTLGNPGDLHEPLRLGGRQLLFPLDKGWVRQLASATESGATARLIPAAPPTRHLGGPLHLCLLPAQNSDFHGHLHGSDLTPIPHPIPDAVHCALTQESSEKEQALQAQERERQEKERLLALLKQQGIDPQSSE